MQPIQPNPWIIVVMMLAKMIGTAGLQEQRLQGSSSVVNATGTNVHADVALLMTAAAAKGET